MEKRLNATHTNRGGVVIGTYYKPPFSPRIRNIFKEVFKNSALSFVRPLSGPSFSIDRSNWIARVLNEFFRIFTFAPLALHWSQKLRAKRGQSALFFRKSIGEN